MKVLAFGASNSTHSINQKLALYAAETLKSIHDSIEIEPLELQAYEMPLYSADREAENGIPSEANSFLEKIAQADALIISFAEHNGGYTAAFKNVFDWASRVNPKVYQGKKVFALSTSPGPGGASSVLESFKNSAPYFDANITATLSVPSFGSVFDENAAELTDNALKKALLDGVSTLVD